MPTRSQPQGAQGGQEGAFGRRPTPELGGGAKARRGAQRPPQTHSEMQGGVYRGYFSVLRSPRSPRSPWGRAGRAQQRRAARRKLRRPQGAAAAGPDRSPFAPRYNQFPLGGAAEGKPEGKRGAAADRPRGGKKGGRAETAGFAGWVILSPIPHFDALLCRRSASAKLPTSRIVTLL